MQTTLHRHQKNKLSAEQRGSTNAKIISRQKQQKVDKSQANGVGKTDRPSLEDHIPFWRNLNTIAQYQKSIAENLRGIFPGTELYQKYFQFAPASLWQEILRSWSFSVFNFTKEIRGNPEMETKILTEVAGYGSQLGTIMDFLNVIDEKYRENLKNLPEEQMLMVLKFRDLYRKINQAKGRVQAAQ